MFSLVTTICSCMEVTTILIGLFVFLVVGYIVAMRERAGLPPGPTFLPLIGNFLDIRGRDSQKKHKYFGEMMKKYGSIYRVYFGKQVMIILSDVESINEAFVNQKNLFNQRPIEKLWGSRQMCTTGCGLIWSNDEHWKTLRRMTLHTLRDLGVGKSTLEERIKNEANFVIDSLIQTDGKPIIVREILMKATCNIISSVVFGSRFEYHDSEFIQILSFMNIVFNDEGTFTPLNILPQIRFLPIVSSKINEVTLSFHKIEDFMDRMILEHKESLDKENPRDFIDVCLLNQEDTSQHPISDITLTKTIMDLFLAGTDTTANTLDWALLYMIQHTDVQQKCHQEIDKVADCDRMVSWADRQKMPYVEATLMEVQRIATILPLTIPHTASQDTLVKGYLIPQGSLVHADLRACHLDNNSWDEPLAFKPERFLNEAGKPTKNANFLPFSTGPRICPGKPLAKMELFLIFTNILKRFTLSKRESADLCTEGLFGVTMSTETYYMHATCR